MHALLATPSLEHFSAYHISLYIEWPPPINATYMHLKHPQNSPFCHNDQNLIELGLRETFSFGDPQNGCVLCPPIF